MKKVFSFAAIAALTMFAVSCGNGADEAKRKADSAHIADSTKMANDAIEAKRVADSAHMADSLAMVAKQMEDKRIADSIEAASKKGTSKPKPKPVIPKGEPKVGGHR
jgi:hypothetical protein